MAYIGDILSELRRDRNVKQEVIANLLGITSDTVSNYETGKHMPSLESVRILADFFDVTTDYLLGRTDNQQSPKILDMTFLDKMTVNQMVERLMKLSPISKRTIIEVLDGLLLKDDIMSKYDP